MKPIICILVICIALFNSCENKERVKVPDEEATTGPIHCNIHDETLLEEETKYLIGSVSWSETREEAMQSGAFKAATEELFPNSNNHLGVAQPGTETAKKVEGKVFRRRFCKSCREAEEAWWETRMKSAK